MKRLTALRRGLGRGFLRALKAAQGAGQDVLLCILRDPRWDRQVDERAAYYAQLMVATSASWEPLEACLEGYAAKPELDFSDRRLVLEVLAQAAWRGQQQAASLLARFLEHPLLLEDIRSAVFHTGGAPLISHVLGPAQLGWLDLEPPPHFPEAPLEPTHGPEQILPRLEQAGPRLAEAIGERSSVAQLLHYRKRAGLHGYLKVMRLLGRKGCVELLPEAMQALSRPNLHPLRRRAYLKYLEELPGNATLHLARSWLNHPFLDKAAHCILRRWAEPEDASQLIAAGDRALQCDDQRGLCSLIQALDRLGQPGSVEFLLHAYEEMTYSFGRSFVVKALGRHRKRPDVAKMLEESLWDSQACVRSLAAGMAWLPQRLRHMGADPFEDHAVQDAATRSFLGGAPWSTN